MRPRPCRRLCGEQGDEWDGNEHVNTGSTGQHRSRFHCAVVFAWALVLAACGGLPEVQYVTPRLELATGFDAPVCAGTLDSLDAHLERVGQTLGLGLTGEPIRVYWLSESETEDICGEGTGGCFFPATRVVFGQESSLTHELVHAALDSRGDSSFLEEGMAEMLSGVGVYYDARATDASVAERIDLSRSEYRDGGVDYAAAGHFVRWVFETGGTAAMVNLATELEHSASADEIVATLQEAMSDPIDVISERYRAEAPKYYRGLDQSGVSGLLLDDLRDGVLTRLDCADKDTRGPLRDGEAGQYRVFRVSMPSAGRAMIEVSGSPQGFIDLIDPYARVTRGPVQDWTQPDPQLDPNARRVGFGGATPVQVKARDYLLVVGTRSLEPAEVTVRVTPPPTRSSGVKRQ